VRVRIELSTSFPLLNAFNHQDTNCLCVFCVGPLCGPPLRWWILCGALPSVWVPCVGPLCGSPVWVPCVGPLCVGPLCGSPVWVPRRAVFHVASTRVMPPARSHAPAYQRGNFPVQGESDSSTCGDGWAGHVGCRSKAGMQKVRLGR